MKKIPLLLVLILSLSITSVAQELQHEAVAVNIEVPVRVYKGDMFMDTLSLDDFEIYEDGVLQTVEALYLIKKATVAREETEHNTSSTLRQYVPELSRTFVLIFEMNEYLPKLGEVVDHFFFEMIRPGETLQVITPAKAYNFNKRAFEVLSKEQLAQQLKEKLRQDIKMAGEQYKGILRDYRFVEELEETVGAEGLPIKEMLMNYVQQLKHYKTFHEQKFVDYAALLKKEAGQKHLFMFYQQELLPIPSMITINSMDYFDLMSEVGVDFDKIKQAFSDSSISSHFIYITKPGSDESGFRPSPDGIHWLDNSAEIFGGFKEVADATGGLVQSSANAAASFQKAADAAEQYYLLYYKPKDYQEDGKFRNIKVKVKMKGCRITHRAGYIAD